MTVQVDTDTTLRVTRDDTDYLYTWNGTTSYRMQVSVLLAGYASTTYVDTQIAAATVGLYDDRGNFDASGGAYPSSGGSGSAGAILKGDIWRISVGGTLPTGVVVEPNDTIRALVDTPGNTQANWAPSKNNAQTSVSGNAGTATALQTSRNIDGQAFNGTADITVIAPGTHAATGKTTPVDADEMPLADSAASFVLKKLTWANLKATLKTYFDTLYGSGSGSVTTVSVTTANGVSGSVANATTTPAITLTLGAITPTSVAASGTVTGSNLSGTNTGNETTTTEGALINGATAKTTPVDADYIGLMDSAASNVLKKLSWANTKATLKTYFDTLYTGSGSLTADEITYWTAQCAMLDPAAFVHQFSSSFSVTVPTGKTYYVFNAWNARLGGNGGDFFLRDPSKPMAISEGTNLQGNGTANAFLYYCDPSLVSYADPKAKYYERLARLQVLICNHVYATTTAGSATLGYGPFPSDFSNGLIVAAQAFDVAWTILTNTSAVNPGKLNLMNEISDSHQWRSAASMMLPFQRSVFSGIGVSPASVSGTGTVIAGNGSVMYYKLPSDW